MSRGSQLFWLLNARKWPDKEAWKVHYTDLSPSDALKKARRDYRRSLRKPRLLED